MKRNKLVLLVGALCTLLLAFSMVSTAMAAEDFKRWSVGLQMMYLDPDTDSSDLSSATGIGLSAEDTMTGGLTVEYFATPNFSAELVAAIAHVDLDLKAGGEYIGGGKTWLLPPSLYVKYHPMPKSKVSPYIGVGVCWIMPWDEELTIEGERYGLEIDSAFGWAAKAGADIHITGNLYASVDIMYLDAEHELDISDTPLRNIDVDLKVWSYNIGMKYRF